MDQTDGMLVELMGGLDLTLLEEDYPEADLERGRTAWLATFFREKNWRKDAEEPAQESCAGEEGMMKMAETQKKRLKQKEKRTRKMRAIEKMPLSYEWGEAIRTDMGKRLHDGMRNMKRRAAAVWGFVSGVVTMAVIALSFVAIIEKKKRTV